ncbi:hypothetical protein [Flagellimonas olearia]|nr:hypothetical protein [Allomuricauda olearia]
MKLSNRVLFLGIFLLFLSCSKGDNPDVDEETKEQEEEVVELPVLSTVQITEISHRSAKSGGTITSDGGASISQKGICWHTEKNPTINNSYTIDGDDVGSFNSNMDDLDGNTTYYVRAYATNEVGTSYGNELIFKTEEVPVVVFDGDLELASQAEVDEVGEKGYTVITGSLSIITRTSLPSDITNLDGLKQVTEVGESLHIQRSRIANLDALSNLKTIGGSLSIISNSILEEIDFLNEMTEIKSDVVISSNGVSSVSGFKKVTSVNGDLSLTSLVDLETMDGFGSLVAIKGSLQIQSVLGTNMSGFNSLNTVDGDLEIKTTLMNDMDGFNSLKTIGGSLTLLANISLDNVDGLGNLSSIGGDLIFYDNDSPFNNNFTDGLKNLDGLINLISVGGELQISSHKPLNDFCGLKALAASGFSGNYQVNSNGYNPTLAQLVSEECKSE